MKKILSLFIFFIFTTIILSENNPYSIKIFTKEELYLQLPFVANLRINIFREYPYLYDGNFNEEMNDLQQCAKLEDNAIAIAYHHDTPNGIHCNIKKQE
jgi:hypothetical protein